jgi:hypothetical protein
MLRGLVLSCALPAVASAGTVIGKLELPAPPERPALQTKGFLDRVENPLANVRPMSAAPDIAIVLEGEGATPSSQGQVTWDLAGESFVRHVLAVPVGTEVVIKNTSFTPRTITAAEDAKLVQGGPLNPKGTKSFRTTEAGKVYTITDRDAPYIKGKLIVVGTMYTASVDEVSPTSAKFQIDNVTPGKYTLKVFYKDRWLDVQQPVEVTAKGKAEPTVKLPAWPAGDKARP